MGMYDTLDLSQLTDPNYMAQQGQLAALSQAAQPRLGRMGWGADLAAALGALGTGKQAGLQETVANRMSMAQMEQQNLQLTQTLAGINYYRQRNGLAPINMQDLQSPNLSLTAATQNAPQQQPQAQPQAPQQSPAAASSGPVPQMYGATPNDTVPGIAKVENPTGNPNAVSPKGATGPMQVMPSTSANPGFGVKPAQNKSPQENQRVGSDYYNAMVNEFHGNQTLGLIAYNMGPTATHAWLTAGGDFNKLPAETQQYLGRIAVAMVPRGGQAPNAQPAQPGPQAAAPAAPAAQPPTPSPLEGINQIGVFDPRSATQALEKWFEPQNVRSGSAVTGLDPNTGRIIPYFKNPNVPEGYTTDESSGTQTVVPVPGGPEAVSDIARREAEAKVPAKNREAGFQGFLETGGTGMTDASGNLKPQYAQPPGVPPPAAAPSPGQSAQQPAATSAQQPGINAPLKTKQGTTIPALSEAAPINPGEEYLKTRIPQWAETENEWNDALPSGVIAEQRALAIANALKATQSGQWAEEKAGVVAALRSAGVPIPDNTNLGDPSAVQEVLKNNFQSTLNQIRAFSARPAAIEVQLASKNFANPNLQPAANLQIIGETVGTLRWERAMLNDWAQAKQMGWQDPQDFQRAWTKANPIQGFVDSTEKQIGPLKGMPGFNAGGSSANGAPQGGAAAPKADPAIQNRLGSLSAQDWSRLALKKNVDVPTLKQMYRDSGYKVQ